MGGTVDFKGCITHGPWGASDGEEWVYKPENFIRKIIVNYCAVVIDSIRFQTGEIESSWFGDPRSGGKSDTISINYPLEYLVSISGTFGSFDGYDDVVKSLCFKTNVTSYGPYGTNSGTAFSYDGKGGMVLGFHGRAHKYLTAIGVYVIPESLASAPSSTYVDKIMPEVISLSSDSLWLVFLLSYLCF
ncbi:putative jacalin-like lectin domain-containing protein [Helianthus anomalus]